MREEVRNEGASGDGLISLQQLGAWNDANAASGQTGPKGPRQQLLTMVSRWPQGRRKVAELCNALGPRPQWGRCSFPDFSLPLVAFSRLAGLVFLLVSFLFTVCTGFQWVGHHTSSCGATEASSLPQGCAALFRLVPGTANHGD